MTKIDKHETGIFIKNGEICWPPFKMKLKKHTEMTGVLIKILKELKEVKEILKRKEIV